MKFCSMEKTPTYDDKVAMLNERLKGKPTYVFSSIVDIKGLKRKTIGAVACNENEATTIIRYYCWQHYCGHKTIDVDNAKRLGSSKQSKHEVVERNFTKLIKED